MSRFNLVIGAVLGLSAVLSGVLLDKSVKSQLDDDLKEKAVPIPAVVAPDGTKLRDASSEIPVLDRRESDEKWAQYQNGNRYLMLNGIALIALGLIGRFPNVSPRTSAIGGGLFVVGTLLYAVGMTAAILFKMPIIATFAPIGGILLAGGWGCLAVAAYQAKQ